MIGGLDLVISNALKNLLTPVIAPIAGLTGSTFGTAIVLLYPAVIVFSKHMDRKIKERNKK